MAIAFSKVSISGIQRSSNIVHIYMQITNVDYPSLKMQRKKFCDEILTM